MADTSTRPIDEHSMHTHTCGELRRENVGEEVTLTGWVSRRRDHGGLIFCDLRDREGITQLTFDPEHSDGDAFKIAETMRPEWPIKIHGVVRARGEETTNVKLATGEIEVLTDHAEVLNTSMTPPFQIEDGIETSEDTRAFFLRGSSHKHFDGYAEARNHLTQMERLIGNERTQRIEEDALFVLLERQFDREEVEDERFAPSRSHDREHRLPRVEQLERLGLRFMKRRCSNKSRSKLAAQSLRFSLREHLPLLAVALNESVRRFFLRLKRSRGTRIAI